ncbi:MAG TPA: aconitate hydratase AcnA [Pyrinomonadaceae bacterium]|nr:aconitate hydratase AcnA [Pyrinomonadaceae bacterium]
MPHNLFNTLQTFNPTTGSQGQFYSLPQLEKEGVGPVSRLPVSIRIVLESVLRNFDGKKIREQDVRTLANWKANAERTEEIPFIVARVLLQDFTGVPLLVDLAAMRSAVERMGKETGIIEPLVPVDLVIDHSVQVDFSSMGDAFQKNMEMEFRRNNSRYQFLKWGMQAFDGFRVVPPGIGIVHQVNLEYLARGVWERDGIYYPDTLVGTDSHTTMINGLGIVAWGVGGIEAEAGMLGQPVYFLTPDVVGVHMSGSLKEGVTATDLVLRVTEMLRQAKVVGKFVEFHGEGAASLPATDRATIANMAPEYGATMGFFPVDEETCKYLRATGREEEQVEAVKNYFQAQGLFGIPRQNECDYSTVLELNLSEINPSVAGPKRPQDRIELPDLKDKFVNLFQNPVTENGYGKSKKDLQKRYNVSVGRNAFRQSAALVGGGGQETETVPEVVDIHTSQIDTSPLTEIEMMNNRPTPDRVGEIPPGEFPERFDDLGHGDVVIAAITSCTNTSNPSVMLAAGLLAKKAVERGLVVDPSVKTSLAPGSRVVTEYLEKTGLQPYLNQLGFNLVGYGCTTCLAAGTPVLLANGTSQRIEEMPGGAMVFGPTSDGRLGMALQTEQMFQGVRDCVSLVLQDGRTLVCTPDHKILCADGRWVRADELELGRDRVVVGLDAPLDEPGEDEAGYVLLAGDMQFTLDKPDERPRALAFARLLGHLLSDGSISAVGQGRMNVGQALDREAVLNDIELVTGKRPAAARYDERKWTVVLPRELTAAISALPGVRVGRRINQPAALPAFVLDESCPIALIREFLGGLFGADGWAPVLHRLSTREKNAVLEPPAFSQSAKPEHVSQLREMMGNLIHLLDRCGVKTDGAKVYEYPTRHAASSYPASVDGAPRVEVRLNLPDGLSFVECVGFRYCVDKALRASAAAVYWRTVDKINEQRLWMSERLEARHAEDSALSFVRARASVAAELVQCETAVFPHYSLLEGHDRFNRLPQPGARKFQPLHRESCGFPSPVELFRQIGAREWFAPLSARAEMDTSRRYCAEKESLTLPTLALQVLDRRQAGKRAVFDLSVNDLHAFIAGTVAVHNCIGNSGPLDPRIEDVITKNDLIAASVLSGNRNFEARVHQSVKVNFLMSPPLVVAFALAGRVNVDLSSEPVGKDRNGSDVYLRDIWPNLSEISEMMSAAMDPETYRRLYSDFAEQNPLWNEIPSSAGDVYEWDQHSTYIQEPPYFEKFGMQAGVFCDIRNARPLAIFGDSVTTDHISPAGAIKPNSPAGKYLQLRGVNVEDFNSYGSRRGNHQVMVRGTFANVRIKNLMAPGTEGGVTILQPIGEQMSIYDASVHYQAAGIPLIVFAGQEYGTGSSRDWAAKGTRLLGVHAVVAQSFERIHRSNLVGMGVLPLQFKEGTNAASLKLDGTEVFDLTGLETGAVRPQQEVTLAIRRSNGETEEVPLTLRIDTPIEVDYYQHGGILPYVLRQLIKDQ